jgi:hypothetical protein
MDGRHGLRRKIVRTGSRQKKSIEDILEANGVGGRDESCNVEAVAGKQAIDAYETVSMLSKTDNRKYAQDVDLVQESPGGRQDVVQWRMHGRCMRC